MPTIKSDVKLSGRGIHSGADVSITVRPRTAPGIVFQRTDIDGAGLIPARFDNVGESRLRNTTIGNPAGAHVQTIEHLMAALFMSGIDRAQIDITGPETPILDGSAAEYYSAFAAAGVTAGKMRKIIVRRAVRVDAREIRRTLPRVMRMKLWIMDRIAGRRADGFVELRPNDGAGLHIVATLVYPEKIIGRQTFEYTFDGTKKSVSAFVENIARARTFGKYSEWEYLKSHGMGRGADATNVIALNDAGDGTLNELHWADEFVRHKIIDAVGDMATSGGVIVADMISFKGSHAMNNAVLKKLFSDARNYDIV